MTQTSAEEEIRRLRRKLAEYEDAFRQLRRLLNIVKPDTRGRRYTDPDEVVAKMKSGIPTDYLENMKKFHPDRYEKIMHRRATRAHKRRPQPKKTSDD